MKQRLLFLFGLMVLAGAFLACGESTTTTGGTTTTPSQSITWKTTHTYTGNGSKKTETFAVPGDWKIQWSCTVGSFGGIDYNVIAMVDNSDGTPADPSAINTTCKSGNASGETEEHTSGNVYLDITSEGDWKFSIQEPS